MEEVTELYKKGFNHGYILAQHEPELADMLSKASDGTNEYLKALASGKEQYQAEKLVNKSMDTKHNQKDIEPEKDIER